MITVEIFDDGSAIKTFSYDFGENKTHPMTVDQVQYHLKTSCTNRPNGCGICITCAVKAGYQEWRAKKIRDQAGEYLTDIDENDFVVAVDAPVEFVDGGAWVQCSVWIPINDETDTENPNKETTE